MPARAATVALFVAWVLAQLVYALLPATLERVGNFVIVGLFIAFSALHLALSAGWRNMAVLLGLCVVVAGGLEVVSVRTGFPFGRYVYSEQFGPGIWGVSALVPVCWFMMAHPAWRTSTLLFGMGWWRVPVAAYALSAWDLFLDPQMVRAGHWVWLEPAFYAGIPLVNYAGWLLTSSIIFVLYERIFPEAPTLKKTWPKTWFDALPVLAYVWTWLGSSVVNAVWWSQPLVALVGGVGMGVVALPALYKLQKSLNTKETPA